MKLKVLLIIFLLLLVTYDNTTINNNNKNIVKLYDISEVYYNKCLNFLKEEEGLELKPYRCSSKKWTIGYGHRIKKDEWRKFRKGITEKEALLLLVSDYNEAVRQVKQSLSLEEDDKYTYLYAVLCFQTGQRGFEEFDDFIEAVEFSKNNDNPDAKRYIYESIVNSKIYTQCKNRMDRYIAMLTIIE